MLTFSRTKADASSPSFCCYRLDPILDPRWGQLVERHPLASVFHSVPWLRALQRTYGYKAEAFTTSPPASELKNGMVFCHVDSWLTGRRLVSLPFSDHCEPLCDSTEDVGFLIRYLQSTFEHEGWKYFQVRPIHRDLSKIDGIPCLPAEEYFLHKLDLRPDLDELFRGFDKDSVQRRIQRAKRAGLVEKCGRSKDLLRDFYALFLMTRRRQRVPPTPYGWFRNLVDELGEALEIRMAYKEKTPVVAIITLRFGDVVTYKYGCSDERFNRYGATPLLLWQAIVSAKSQGATEFDFGRTQQENAGLLAFKNRWVPQPARLVYWQYPYATNREAGSQWRTKLATHCFSLMPQIIQTSIGKLLYRHVG